MAIERPLYNNALDYNPAMVYGTASWATISATSTTIPAANIKGGQRMIKSVVKGAAGIYTVTFRDLSVDDMGFMVDLSVPAGGPYNYATVGPRVHTVAGNTLQIFTVGASGAALADPTNDVNSRIVLSVSFLNTTLPA